jgi:hypothetical protein
MRRIYMLRGPSYVARRARRQMTRADVCAIKTRALSCAARYRQRTWHM